MTEEEFEDIYNLNNDFGEKGSVSVSRKGDYTKQFYGEKLGKWGLSNYLTENVLLRAQ